VPATFTRRRLLGAAAAGVGVVGCLAATGTVDERLVDERLVDERLVDEDAVFAATDEAVYVTADTGTYRLDRADL
jgi:hypothetical protein